MSHWLPSDTHDSRKTALDIGCCYGFFSINLAKKGFGVVGIDLSQRSIRIAIRAAASSGADSCSFMRMLVTPENISLLPNAKVVVCLAVWHHWVKHYGIESATGMLQSVWNNTGSVLFFESGESQDKDEFDLPFGDTAGQDWLADYLADVCVGGTVNDAGQYSAGAYEKYGTEGALRTLFVVQRSASSES